MTTTPVLPQIDSAPLRERPQRTLGGSPRVRTRLARIGMHACLIAIALVFAFPFYWLVVIATSNTNEIFASPPRLIPGTEFFHNLAVVFSRVPFLKAFFNSFFVTLVASFLQVMLAALAGFVFARHRFPGRDKLFAILLVTMALPTGVALVPSYQIYSELGWIDTFLPLIVPGAVTAFGVFWMRQAAASAVQNEIIEAARIDGAGFLRVFWHVGLPALRPTIAGLGIFQIMWNWNDYLWPQLVLHSPENATLPVALDSLKGAYGATDYAVVMSGTLLATVPLIVLFLIFRRTVMSNVVAGAVKG